MRKTIKMFSLLASFALSGLVSPVLADTTAPAAATPTATAAPTPAVSVNGFVDGYYAYNFTNSSNSAVGKGITGYNFNSFDDTFNLGLGEVDVNAVLGTTSAHLSLITGDTALAILGSGNWGVGALQAYVAYAPGQWTFDLGRFATWMGNEVIQSKSNWNYSRSLLFVYTIPYFNQGFSAGWASSDSKFAATAYLTDGWNNNGVAFSPTSGGDLGKTYGLEVKYTPDATFNVVLNGIMGPAGAAGAVPYGLDTAATRSVYEAIVNFVPNGGSFSLALDAEMGSTNVPGGASVTLADGKTTATSLPFIGVDLYARYQIQSDWAVALRLEELADSDNSLGLYGLGSSLITLGPPVVIYNDIEAREATLTVEHNFSTNLLLRVEGRMDMAYSGGKAYAALATPLTQAPAGPFAGGSGTQTTGTASMVMSF